MTQNGEIWHRVVVITKKNCPFWRDSHTSWFCLLYLMTMVTYCQTAEKIEKIGLGVESSTIDADLKTEALEDDGEVFKSHTGRVQFRALGW